MTTLTSIEDRLIVQTLLLAPRDKKTLNALMHCNDLTHVPSSSGPNHGGNVLLLRAGGARWLRRLLQPTVRPHPLLCV